MRIFRALVVVAVLFVVGGAIAKAGGGSAGRAQNTPSRNATEANTPRVGPHGSVEVDDLRWRLHWAETATGVNNSNGEAVSADGGIFVVCYLDVTSRRGESASLNDEVVDLAAAGNIYKPDTAAEVAYGSGQYSDQTLSDLPELQPGLTAESVVVIFAVPRSVLSEHPALRFNELGFGETHGYIALPTKTP